MRFKYYYSIFLLFVILTCSCTFQQRLYRPGFNVAWNGEKSITDEGGIGKNTVMYGAAGTKAHEPEKNGNAPIVSESIGNDLLMTVAEGESHDNTIRFTAKHINNVCKVRCDSCDLIVLRDGNEINALVKELTPAEVKYKRCEMPGGPTITINRNDILFIRYADGTKEVFKQERQQKQERAHYYHKSIHPGGVLAMVAGLVGIIIFGIPMGITAIITGISSLAKINRESDRFYGRAFGVIAIIIGTLDIIGVLIYLSTL